VCGAETVWLFLVYGKEPCRTSLTLYFLRSLLYLGSTQIRS
jgi:hypothetical protein